MFFAINSQTGERVNSITIEKNPSYQFIKEDMWYADPDEIESCPKNINIQSISVRFREGGRAISCLGNKFVISPHFYIPNKEKLGINTIPESKEHKLAKNWIYNKIKEKKLILNYSTIKKPFKYSNKINLFDLPVDYDRVGIECSSSTYGLKSLRRADVICPLKQRHPLLGEGVVFEIQFSQQKSKTKIDRELDWAIRGFSTAWLFSDDFEAISDNFIELKKESINVNSFAAMIKMNNKSFIKNLKISVQELSRKLDYKKEEIESSLNKLKNELTNLSIKKLVGSENLDDFLKEKINIEMKKLRRDVQPMCPTCNIRATLRKNKSNGSTFWSCSTYPKCIWTMQATSND